MRERIMDEQNFVDEAPKLKAKPTYYFHEEDSRATWQFIGVIPYECCTLSLKPERQSHLG